MWACSLKAWNPDPRRTSFSLFRVTAPDTEDGLGETTNHRNKLSCLQSAITVASVLTCGPRGKCRTVSAVSKQERPPRLCGPAAAPSPSLRRPSCSRAGGRALPAAPSPSAALAACLLLWGRSQMSLLSDVFPVLAPFSAFVSLHSAYR